MKTKLKLLAAGVMLFVALLFPVSLATAATSDVFENNPACTSASGTNVCGSKSDTGIFAVVKTVIQVLLLAAGVIAIIMIIIGGLRYMTSNGEQAQVKAAKETILYAVIGLVVTLLAYAIVTWVVNKV